MILFGVYLLLGEFNICNYVGWLLEEDLYVFVDLM